MSEGAWNEYEASELAEHVGTIVGSMILDRDSRIKELERVVDEQQSLIDGLEKDIDLADEDIGRRDEPERHGYGANSEDQMERRLA